MEDRHMTTTAKFLGFVVGAVALYAASSGLRAQEGRAQDTLRAPADGLSVLVQARHLEKVSHQPEEAVALYASAAADPELAAARREEALLGQVRCLLKVGRAEDAESLVAGLGATSLTAAVREGLASLFALYVAGDQEPGREASPALHARLESLVKALSKAEAECRAESSLLKSLGEVAVPHLLRAIRTSMDLKVQENGLKILAEIALDHPGGPAERFFAELDREPDLVLVQQGLSALSYELWRRRDTKSRPPVYPPVPRALHDMLDRLTSSDAPLIGRDLMRLMGLRDDDMARNYLVRMTGDPDSVVRSNSFNYLLGKEPSPEMAAKAAADPSFDVRRNFVVLAGETKLPALVLAALESPYLGTRLDAWQAERATLEVLPSLDDTQRTKLAHQLVQDLVLLRHSEESKGLSPAGFLLDYRKVLPVSALDLLELIQEWKDDSKVVEYVVTVLARKLTDPQAYEVLGELAADSLFVERVAKALERSEPREQRDEMLASIVHQRWPHSQGGGISLEILADSTAPIAAQAFRNAAEAVDWKVSELPMRPDNEERVYSMLFGEMRPGLGEDVKQVLEHGVVKEALSYLAQRVLPALPRGPAILEDAVLLEALTGVLSSDMSDDVKIRAFDILASTESSEVVLSALRKLRVAKPSRVERAYREQYFSLAFPSGHDILARVRSFFAEAHESAIRAFSSSFLYRLSEVVSKEEPGLMAEADVFLVELFGSRVSSAPEYAFRSLDWMHPDGTVPEAIVRTALESTNLGLRSNALEYVATHQVRQLRGSVEQIVLGHGDYRVTAIKTLMSLMDPASVPALLHALGDPDEEIREAARKALENLRLYMEEKARWEQFEATGGKALSALTALVRQTRDPEPEVRIAAIRSLAALGNPEALPHLIELLRDADAQIKEEARKAIEILTAKPADVRPSTLPGKIP
ncbi:MAG: HEAT repeat domain-containing protein [Planctomycetota bacterium]